MKMGLEKANHTGSGNKSSQNFASMQLMDEKIQNVRSTVVIQSMYPSHPLQYQRP
jgi:hypothetical protein